MIKNISILFFFLVLISFSFAATTVTRDLSSTTVSLNQVFNVTLNVSLPVITGAIDENYILGIEEKVPAGFLVTDKNGANLDSSNVLKWFFLNAKPGTTKLTYLVKAQGNAGKYSFDGNFMTEDSTTVEKIIGKTDLNLQVTCTDFNYSAWTPSTCTSGNQTRTVTLSYPTGCTGGNPILSQPCVYKCVDLDKDKILDYDPVNCPMGTDKIIRISKGRK